MEKLRRSIKVFWVEHRDPILFYTIVIVVIITILKILNGIAIIKNKEKNEISEISKSNESTAAIKKSDNNIKIIKNFIDYCKKTQIENAYEMLSENCKKNIYPTIDDFMTKYYNKMFKQDYDIKVKYDDNIYKIIFYESALKTGKVNNKEIAIQYCKIENDGLESKIYIYSNNK